MTIKNVRPYKYPNNRVSPPIIKLKIAVTMLVTGLMPLPNIKKPPIGMNILYYISNAG